MMVKMMVTMLSIPVDTPIPHLGHCLQASTLKLSGQFIIMMLIMIMMPILMVNLIGKTGVLKHLIISVLTPGSGMYVNSVSLGRRGSEG